MVNDLHLHFIHAPQIRLQEARRLMLGEDLDVASASNRVGYEDPSYFSREYKKLFGAPPQRDIARLRAAQLIGTSFVFMSSVEGA